MMCTMLTVCLPAGYTGQDCEEDVDECVTQPCHNGGLCLERSNPAHYGTQPLFPSTFSYSQAAGFLCQCQPGFTGELHSKCPSCLHWVLLLRSWEQSSVISATEISSGQLQECASAPIADSWMSFPVQTRLQAEVTACALPHAAMSALWPCRCQGVFPLSVSHASLGRALEFLIRGSKFPAVTGYCSSVFLVRLLWWLQLCNQSGTRGVSWYEALAVRSSVDVPLKYHPFHGLEKCVKCWI